MRGNGFTLTIGIAAAGALAAPSAGSMLGFQGITGPTHRGAYHGTMEWIAPGEKEDCGTLIVSLTNDSPAANGGFLTGFAFQVIDGLTLQYLAEDAFSENTWQHISDVHAPPYGTFDYGAALGGNWLGGGNPNFGIGVGDTKLFAFEVCGSRSILDSIDVFAFFDDDEGYGFVARFKGFEDGGSDKLPAVVPVPGALALAAVAGALARRRTR
jgi:MYXO-CTERM domain-containing protein